jgi:hypothetical protein
MLKWIGQIESGAMNKKTEMIIGACFVLLIILLIIVTTGLNGEVRQKDAQISELNMQMNELQNQVDNLQKATLVTSIGTSPRAYPQNHLTIEGVVINVGTKTAYNASLHVVAYYPSGLLALDRSLPLGDLAKWQTINVEETLMTADFLANGNYTVTPMWTNIPP